MSTSKTVLIDRYFKEGVDVEISSNDEGLIGSWYLGTIIRVERSSLEVVVEYKTLMDEKDERLPLRENMELVNLRPPQPAEERHKFRIDDDVDAYYHDGWWEGIITGFVGEDKYAVFFRHTREQRAFKASKLRLHREWVYGKWHPSLEQRQNADDAYMNEKVPLSAEMHDVPLSAEVTPNKKQTPFSSEVTSNKEQTPFSAEFTPNKEQTPFSAEVTPNKEQTKHGFRAGQFVEASSDEDGFEGAWYLATVLQILNAGKYLIEYQTLLCDDEKTLLTEEVESKHIRPCPPEVSIVDRFDALEEVEAWYNDGWWDAVIYKVLKDDKYIVYFRTTDEEMKFKHSELRVKQEWKNGQWVTPTKAVEL